MVQRLQEFLFTILACLLMYLPEAYLVHFTFSFCLFVWFLNVLVNNKAISRTGPKTERLTMLSSAAIITECHRVKKLQSLHNPCKHQHFILIFLLRSGYMSRIPRHVSTRVYVSHSETSKQPSVDLIHISRKWECEIHGGFNGITNELTPKL